MYERLHCNGKYSVLSRGIFRSQYQTHSLLLVLLANRPSGPPECLQTSWSPSYQDWHDWGLKHAIYSPYINHVY
jgi:hypothetical protein